MQYLVAFLVCVYALTPSISTHESQEDLGVGGTADITYTLWIDNNTDPVRRQYSISLSVPAGTSFHDVMTQAATIDKTFSFGVTTFPNVTGHFVTDIADVPNDFVNNFYWMIYILTDPPIIGEDPGPGLLSDWGVDYILVEDGKHYLFWFQHFVWEEDNNGKLIFSQI